MALFSERYGYLKPSEVIIRERITPEIENVMCSCFDRLESALGSSYFKLERRVWTHFLNKRESDIVDQFGFREVVSTNFIIDKSIEWYRKLDLVEFVVKLAFLPKFYFLNSVVKGFVNDLNSEFARLNYAYRIVDQEIVEITSEEEIKTVETALSESGVTVSHHLNEALKLLSKRPEPDSRNSIKESISAVEAFCREKTGENTLGKALDKLESNGIVIHKMLKDAIEKLYAYTNQKDTGIRHALMEDDGKYVPSLDEAIFMLVTCSSFINYLGKKAQ